MYFEAKDFFILMKIFAGALLKVLNYHKKLK